MQRAAFAMLIILGTILLAGCVYPHYVGVQIASTEPMNVTRVQINGDAVVLCRVGGKKKARFGRAAKGSIDKESIGGWQFVAGR